jgi:hypothetical protein
VKNMAKKEVKKPGPMKVAEPTAKVWVPGIGEITVSELAKTAEERKAMAKAKFVPEELMKQWLTEVANLEYVPGMKGTFTSAMYKELSNKLKEKIGRKAGVSKGVLKKNGYIDRTKVPGYKPFYFLTPKAKELIGAPAPETPTTAAEKALEVLKK